MKAIIFAAGLGTRLIPLTTDKPKALVEFNGQPLISRVIKKLIHSGVTDIIINVHHYAEKIMEYIQQNKWEANITFSDERRFLLDTGGGLKKASYFFNDNKPFFAYNVDILSDIDLTELYEYHIKNHSIATLAVKNRKSSRILLFNKNLQLVGWENQSTNEIKLVKEIENPIEYKMAFSGIHIIEPEIFNLINETGCFSIIDVYLRLAENEVIKAFVHDKNYWFDLGTFKYIEEAKIFLKNLKQNAS